MRRLLLVLAVLAFIPSVPASAQLASDEFTIVVLPDTQHYSKDYPYIFRKQTEWIAANRDRLGIALVLGVGDLVNGGGYLTQWRNADAAVDLLDGRVPYMMAIGNHDYDANDPAGRTASTKNFNTFFGPARYAGYSWYRGSYPAGSNENFYGTFLIKGRKFLVVMLEFYPRQASLDWANKVIRTYPDHEVIVVTHSYVTTDNTRVGRCEPGTSAGPKPYGLESDNNGDDMWSRLVSRHANVSLVLNGHIHGTGRRADLGTNGNLVNQVLANYQGETNGGNGYLRIMKFRPSLNRIDVSTYSPYLNAYRTDAANQFSLKYRATAGDGTGKGIVTGRVFSASDCQKLASARVSTAAGSATTDTWGRYSLTLPANATYNVTASKSGWDSSTTAAEIHETYPASLDLYLGTGPNDASTCSASSASPNVAICSPSDGGTVSSPVRTTAAAGSPAGIRAMEVWVDGVKMHSATTASVDVSLALAPGTRRLTVLAKDGAGNVVKESSYVSVGSSCAGTQVVQICSPGDGATAGSPFRVVADTSSAAQIKYLQLWLDGVKVQHVTGTRMDVSVSAARGTHRLVVTATDANGAVARDTIYVTVP